MLWEQVDWKASRLLHPRSFTWRLGPFTRQIYATALLSGLLLLLMGAAMIWVGLTERSMQALRGWQATFAVDLQHLGTVLTNAFSWLPNWLVGLVLVLVLAWLVRRALKQMHVPTPMPAPTEERENPTVSCCRVQNAQDGPKKETTHVNS